MNNEKYNNESYNKRVVEMKKALKSLLILILCVCLIKEIINLIV
jgi:hypothetical protein